MDLNVQKLSNQSYFPHNGMRNQRNTLELDSLLSSMSLSDSEYIPDNVLVNESMSFVRELTGNQQMNYITQQPTKSEHELRLQKALEERKRADQEIKYLQSLAEPQSKNFQSVPSDYLGVNLSQVISAPQKLPIDSTWKLNAMTRGHPESGLSIQPPQNGVDLRRPALYVVDDEDASNSRSDLRGWQNQPPKPSLHQVEGLRNGYSANGNMPYGRNGGLVNGNGGAGPQYRPQQTQGVPSSVGAHQQQHQQMASQQQQRAGPPMGMNQLYQQSLQHSRGGGGMNGNGNGTGNMSAQSHISTMRLPPPTPQQLAQQQVQMQLQGQPLIDSHCNVFHPEVMLRMDDTIYQVQFKRTFLYFVYRVQTPQPLIIGDFVITECDRGVDLGVVVGILSVHQFHEIRHRDRKQTDEDVYRVRNIIRLANQRERDQLPEKYHDEQAVLQHCIEVVAHIFMLPMNVVDAEYQFDRTKLSVYYTSNVRIDFRELVKNVFSTFQTRIWMKKSNREMAFEPKRFAVLALTTGAQFNPQTQQQML